MPSLFGAGGLMYHKIHTYVPSISLLHTSSTFFSTDKHISRHCQLFPGQDGQKHLAENPWIKPIKCHVI